MKYELNNIRTLVTQGALKNQTIRYVVCKSHIQQVLTQLSASTTLLLQIHVHVHSYTNYSGMRKYHMLFSQILE